MDEIFKTFALKPSKSLGISFQPLYNAENSYKNFIEDLIKFLTIDEIMYTNKNVKNKNENIRLVTSNFSINVPNKDYKICVLEGKNFHLVVKYDEFYISEKIDQNGVIEEEPKENTKKTQEIKIPIYIGYKGKVPLPGIILNDNELGGYFRHNNGIKKYMTHMFSSISSWPKYKSEKNLVHHFSFQSVCSRFNKSCMPQYLTIDSKIDEINNKYDFVIDSKSSFIPLNVLLLIMYLTNFNLTMIKKLLLLDFEDDATIVSNVKIHCIKAKEILEENYKNKKKTKIDNYIDNQINLSLKDSKREHEYHKSNILSNFLPHLKEREQLEKGMFLIIKLRQMLVASYQNSVYPDKDNLMTKRIMPIGSQLENIIIEGTDSYISECKNKIDKKSAVTLINENKNNKYSAIISNTFNNQNKKWSQSIKTETISNNENQSIIISNRIVHSRSLKLNKSLDMRNVHPSTNGWLDPSNTTDHGHNVGLVKSFNIGTKVTHYTLKTNKDIFNELETYIKKNTKKYTDVENGIIISLVDNSEFYINSIKRSYVNEFIKNLKKAKRNNHFSTNDFGIVVIPMHILDPKTRKYFPSDNKYLQIRITMGVERIIRPLIVVEDGIISGEKYVKDFDEEALNDYNIFMKKFPDVIEFIDVEQSVYSNISSSIKEFYQLSEEDKKLIHYIEFPPLSKVSYLTSYLTDIGRIAGARVTLGDAQQKHTLSGMARDNFNKFDNTLNLTLPFEIPCITNDTIQSSNISSRGFGVHLNVASMSWQAKNLEDSIIMSKKCYKSGKLSVLTTTKYKTEVPIITLNSPLPARLVHSHKKLEASGLPKIGTILEKDDAMHKKVEHRFESSDKLNPRSNISYDMSEPSTTNYPIRVDRIRVEGNSNVIIKYLLTSFRYKEIGDKITNQAAQKGTIGCILEDYELPYTEDGITPDIIVNSVSIPSRKTFSFLLQIMLSTAFCANPFDENFQLNLINYPPLTESSLEEFYEKIKKRYNKYNKKLSIQELEDKIFCLVDLYNPYTHKLIECVGGRKHFMGIIYYLALTQMAVEKITSRNRGKKTKLLQAPSGKKRQGGIRFGEMEKEGVACHGASDNILTLLSDSIEDKIKSFICTRCGEFAAFEQNLNVSRWKCLKCESLGYSTELQKFNFTYAAKVFLQALNCRGKIIIPKIKKDKIHYPNFIN